MRNLSHLLVLFALVAPAFATTSPRAHSRELIELSLEELGSIEVISMTKKPERLRETTGAIVVLTQHEIRRSGVVSIPEALRLIPGVQVAQIDSSKWAIGIRGFQSRLSRALLVLVDGRSVYTPLFAGVYWEVQDLLLDDIDRIEVIRGPGGSLWGTNAVNGVINIITKSAAETHGGLVKVASGSELNGSVQARVGGAVGERTHWRVYGKTVSMDGGFHENTPEFDDWRKSQVGFRLDTTLANGDAVSVHGDAYDGDFGGRVVIGTYAAPFSETRIGDSELSGANFVARWSRNRGRVDSKLQSYFDRTRRDELNFAEQRNTFDLDWQQRIGGLHGGHELVWGASYRVSADSTGGDVPTVQFSPRRRTADVFGAFVEDEKSWDGGYRLIFGSKFEHNDYSGLEFQPTVRFAWAPEGADHSLWAALSRAVRTPTRTDTDLSVTANIEPGQPTFLRILGSRSFDSEELVACEAGYRARPFSRVLADVAVFYNDYERLVSLESKPSFTESEPGFPDRLILPFVEENRLEGHSYGLEMLTRLDLRENWRLTLSYSAVVMELRRELGSTDTFSEAAEDSSPRHQAQVWSAFNIGDDLDIDTIVRFVDELPAQDVPRYTELDLQLAWRPRARLTLSLIGKNLLRDAHAEFGTITARVESERRLLARAIWTW